MAPGRPLRTVSGMATRDEARALITLHVQPDDVPALSTTEVEACLDSARVADDIDLAPGADGYTETLWATYAVCQALDVKLAKAATLTDVNADGTTIAQSQITKNLTAARRRWMAQLIPGSF